MPSDALGRSRTERGVTGAATMVELYLLKTTLHLPCDRHNSSPGVYRSRQAHQSEVTSPRCKKVHVMVLPDPICRITH